MSFIQLSAHTPSPRRPIQRILRSTGQRGLTNPTSKKKIVSLIFVFNHIIVYFCWILVKNVIPQSLSPPGTVPWQHQQGPPSPSSVSSGSTSPGYSPSRTLDLSGSSTSFSSERKATHHWQNGPVQEWTKEQVNFLLFRCVRHADYLHIELNWFWHISHYRKRSNLAFCFFFRCRCANGCHF